MALPGGRWGQKKRRKNQATASCRSTRRRSGSHVGRACPGPSLPYMSRGWKPRKSSRPTRSCPGLRISGGPRGRLGTACGRGPAQVSGPGSPPEGQGGPAPPSPTPVQVGGGLPALSPLPSPRVPAARDPHLRRSSRPLPPPPRPRPARAPASRPKAGGPAAPPFPSAPPPESGEGRSAGSGLGPALPRAPAQPGAERAGRVLLAVTGPGPFISLVPKEEGGRGVRGGPCAGTPFPSYKGGTWHGEGVNASAAASRSPAAAPTARPGARATAGALSRPEGRRGRTRRAPVQPAARPPPQPAPGGPEQPPGPPGSGPPGSGPEQPPGPPGSGPEQPPGPPGSGPPGSGPPGGEDSRPRPPAARAFLRAPPRTDRLTARLARPLRSGRGVCAPTGACLPEPPEPRAPAAPAPAPAPAPARPSSPSRPAFPARPP
ncbi:mid1-interacting protein 1 isoform X1 [Macrotis lagotis]|uniref:mid1-interacting protein 1 isoform X1 n=1 Tax=Macrotis lagotis TaxID=92651 RepID=UPI003D697FD1